MPPFPFSRNREEGSGNVLDRAPLLAILEPDLRQRVRKKMARRRVAAGKVLYRQGEPADALYLVESGRFRIFVSERAGHQRVLQFLGPGEIVGEAAFMAETPYVTSAEAVEDANVWRLARADFDALLGKHDALLRYLAGAIAERQSQANARLAAESAPEETRALRGFVTAVFSPRGGAGVTMLAVNLAIALAEKHPDDVVLLDLDVLFGHVLANLWLEPRGVLAQASPTTLRDLDRGGLDRYLLTHSSSLRVFPSSTKPEEGQAITADHVRAALTTLRRHFGHIVLDLPHAFNEVALTGLEHADRVLLVATPEPTTLKDIVETRRIFGEVLGLPSGRLRHILNHPQAYSALAVAEFSAATASPWTEIAYGSDAPAATALKGESLVLTRRNHPVARAIVTLAEQITKEAREVAALSGHNYGR
jgi:CRP-like cAMP-binding protein/MinD-like ATPase involved in chromosome partitioning or flagellar assembly